MTSAAVESQRDPTIVQAGELRSTAIESVRGIAALAILSAHLFGSAFGYDPTATYGSLASRIVFGGGFAVFLFFALSGYLLFWPMAKSLFGSDGRIDFGDYARNRALRILPLYWVVMAILLTVKGADLRSWVLFMGFLENFRPDTVGVNPINGVVWSVVTELQFYILLPFLAYGLAKVTRRSILPAIALLLGIAAVSAVIRFYGTQVVPDDLIRFNLPGTFLFFVPGMVLALLRVRWLDNPPRFTNGVFGYGGVWLAVAAVVWFVQWVRFDWFLLSFLASGLMVAACVLPGMRWDPVARILHWRALALVGVMSYSLYLWHVPVLEWITGGKVPDYGLAGLAAIAVPLCLGVAALSYRLVEVPFLRLRRRWAPAAPAHEQRAPA